MSAEPMPAVGKTELRAATVRRVDVAAVEDLYRKLLEALGEDPNREGLRETPGRVARWWSEFLDFDAGSVDTVFTHRGGDHSVVVGGITAWSLCEHHLLPFEVTVTCGYLPTGQVVGLSKVARIVAGAAHRLQLQERLTDEVAAKLSAVTASPDVGVWAVGRHLCMSMRGIRVTSALTATSCLLGRLRTDHTLAERLRTAVPSQDRT
jgi:GTP cyclohydrolase I